MSDIVLRSTVRARVEIRSFTTTMVERLRSERGQDTIEYIGVVAIVAAIILAVLALATPIGKTLHTDVINKINDIFSSGGGKGSTGPSGTTGNS